jgi:hypothetical protein
MRPPIPIPTNEKSLLELIARFQYLTEYKDIPSLSLAIGEILIC